MPTATYLRVSTEEQREKQTIETQRGFARDYARLYNLGEVLEFADEGYSGIIPLEQRPGGQRLLSAAQAGLIDACYVYRLDRLGRDPRVILNAIDALEKAGARIASMTEQFNTGDAAGRFLVTILSGVAGLERDTIAERTSEGVRRAAKDGRWVGGVVPYGYRVVTSGAGKYLEPNEELLPGCSFSPAGVVRLLYERVGSHGWSAFRATEEIRRLGIPPRNPPGSRLNRLREPAQGIWHAGDIARLLRYPTYKGTLVYGRGSKRGEVTRDCPALVTEELWNVTQWGLTLRREQVWSGAREYLLGSLLVCAGCDFRLSGITTADRAGNAYSYYRCNVKSPRAAHCDHRLLHMEPTDSRIWRRVVQFLDDPERAIDAAEEKLRAAQPEVDVRGDLLLRIGEQVAQRERVARMYQHNRITDEFADERFTEIDREERGLRAQLAALETVAVQRDWRTDALLLAQRAREILGERSDPGTQREVLRLLIRRVLVDREGGEARFRLQWVWHPTDC